MWFKKKKCKKKEKKTGTTDYQVTNKKVGDLTTYYWTMLEGATLTFL